MKQKPVVGAWYVNRTGKLMKVKMMVYQNNKIDAVMIEFLDGHRQVISTEAWSCLELSRNLQQAAKTLLHQ